MAAIVAPSYPAEFTDCDTGGLVAAIRELGFDQVHEVGFGADLVAAAYRDLLESTSERYVATTCPAVVSFVRKYHPDLLDRLAPIVSPMMAIARALHAKEGPDLKIVFVGPCIAKKGESRYAQFEGEVHAALTFVELRAMFAARGIRPAAHQDDDDFDPPHGSLGALFPITRGMLQAAQLDEDLVEGDIISADGRANLADAISDFEHGETEARLLDILCCEGCIMGAGFSTEAHVFARRKEVSRETRRRQRSFDQAGLGRRHGRVRRPRPRPHLPALRPALRRLADREAAPGRAGAHEQVQRRGRARLRRLRLRDLPRPRRGRVAGPRRGGDVPAVRRRGAAQDGGRAAGVRTRSLETTKEALVKSEKLASMGQLAAGIAHEVNNPLGILLLHANLLLEDCDDGSQEADDVQASSSTRPTAARRSSAGCSTSRGRAAWCGSPPTSAPSCRRCCAPSPPTRA